VAGGFPVLDGLGNPVLVPSFLGANGDEYRGRTRSSGLYSYMSVVVAERWTAGFAYDYTQSPLLCRDWTSRYSPYLTWQPSENQALRLQYSYTDRRDPFGMELNDHALFLQWTFHFGSHSHEEEPH
jgi:hypothetical protein